jgi:hypothetical protein
MQLALRVIRHSESVLWRIGYWLMEKNEVSSTARIRMRLRHQWDESAKTLTSQSDVSRRRRGFRFI